MKKRIAIVLIAVLVLVAVFSLTACADKDTQLSVEKYEIAETSVNIGDTRGTPTITATMTDGTTKTVSNNLVYDQTDIDKLKLDKDNKYTTAGDYTVKVYILEEKPEYLLGEWKINVKVTK